MLLNLHYEKKLTTHDVFMFFLGPLTTPMVVLTFVFGRFVDWDEVVFRK